MGTAAGVVISRDTTCDCRTHPRFPAIDHSQFASEHRPITMEVGTAARFSKRAVDYGRCPRLGGGVDGNPCILVTRGGYRSSSTFLDALAPGPRPSSWRRYLNRVHGC